MRNAFLLILIAGVIFTSCKKDEDTNDSSLNPTQTQNGFAINYTASWCGPCGDWGAPLIHDYATAAPNGAIICAHAASGDPMNTTFYGQFSADRTTGGGVPSFWVGDTKTSSAGQMTTLLAQAAIAGVDYKYSVSGTTMTVDLKTKFFSAGTGDYYISVVVLEDGINGNSTAGNYKQNGTTSSYPNDDYKHDFVLRTCANNNAYGELLVSNPASGTETEKSYSITVDATWKNPYPVCIIWKYDAAASAPKYQYINSLKKK